MNIRPNLLEAATFNPISVDAPRNWVGHMPFASWIVNEVKPKIFVELGTHNGNSYFSFCQSVSESKLSTKCYAVDTWIGDEHAGLYGDDIFDKVKINNEEHYAKFSQLMRMNFDTAVAYFDDESIELLHIDGLHTYEAVKHDFETWLPKLAPNAVIMFHDVNERERGFGVWRLWEELERVYPNNLEFSHSHGLGILQLNNTSGTMALPFLQPNFPEKQDFIRYFSSFGSRLMEHFELNEVKADVVNLNQVVADRDAQINLIKRNICWRVMRSLQIVISKVYAFCIMGRNFAKSIFWVIGKKNPKRWISKKIRDLESAHFAKPADSFSLKVPFNYEIKNNNSVPTIAVVCHMYYPELLEEFKGYLENIPFSFDLFITTDTEEKRNEIANGLTNWIKGYAEVRITTNLGRDIAPKLISCSDVYSRYEFFLHIHSKKSPHLTHLACWRPYLLDTLLGSTEIVASIFEAFGSDAELGMIGPEHLDQVRNSIGWGNNFEIAKLFAVRLGIKLSLGGKIDFPSGSMFWGRSAAIKPLLESCLRASDFQREDSQLDGTLAHAIERLYYFTCEQAGFRWIKISRPELLRNSERVIFIRNRESLEHIIKEVQSGLLLSKNI